LIDSEADTPRERKPLQLAPRTGGAAEPSKEAASPVEGSSAPPKKKADPFGGARPIDVTSVEKRVEEKLRQKEAEEKQRLEELKAKREKEKAEAAVAEAADKPPRTEKPGETRTPKEASKTEGASSWRSSGPKTGLDAKKPVESKDSKPTDSNAGWETKAADKGRKDVKDSEGAGAAKTEAAGSTTAEVDLVDKVNSFSILDEEAK